MTARELDNLFTYHPPKGDQAERYELILKKARELAQLLNRACPESREKSQAIATLRMSVMWANASIACNESDVRYPDPEPPPSDNSESARG